MVVFRVALEVASKLFDFLREHSSLNLRRTCVRIVDTAVLDYILFLSLRQHEAHHITHTNRAQVLTVVSFSQ